MSRIVLILGDQLWLENPALLAANPKQDTVLMVEALEESRHVWSHKARSAMFLSAMRHFSATLQQQGWKLSYLRLGLHPYVTVASALLAQAAELKASQVLCCEPGDYRLELHLADECKRNKLALQFLNDTHFMCSKAEFAKWAKAKHLRMEMFYRMMRQRFNVLMEKAASPSGGRNIASSGEDDASMQPVGGQWNFDADNRKAFGKSGPGILPPAPDFSPDSLTKEVCQAVEANLPGHPGSLASFNWPVTREQALLALNDFIEHRLPMFGPFEDAMWQGEPLLYHSRLSAAINLHLLDPREVVFAAQKAFEKGKVDLASAEGFIRQIMGWREFIRGVYHLDMPGMALSNHLQAKVPLPKWFWSGEVKMNCQREVVQQTMQHGYAHHIQRLMVTGNFALIAGLVPQEVAAWYLAVYVDAVEWAELPNVAGMSLYANAGRFNTKPYAASGAYIKRMSNYCQGCPYKPEVKVGEKACPMTTLYWDFLMRHEDELNKNQRAALMMKNLQRMDAAERRAIQQQAKRYLANIDSL